MGKDFNPCSARSKRPCPIWVDAFHRETQLLSADEIGAYFLIIMAMWSRKSCDFPNNERQLAQVSRVSTRLWKSRISVNIMGYFDVVDGWVISSKLRKEATYAERHVTRQRCRKTGENMANLLKDIPWHQTTDSTTDEPQMNHGTDLPNNPTVDDDDSARDQLTEREDILILMGHNKSGVTATGRMVGSQADMLIYEKWKTDLKLSHQEICQQVTETMAKKHDGPPISYKYFTSQMQKLAGHKKSPKLNAIEGTYTNGKQRDTGSISDWSAKASTVNLDPPPDGT